MRVSFCTTCKGRLYHLRQTLRRNIDDHSSCEDVEFVLLDYNSKDGMADWVKATFPQEIASGRLVYFHERTREYYDSSLAKNVAKAASSGEIICNLDADNFTTPDYADTIRRVLLGDPKRFITHGTIEYVGGRVTMWRKDFIKIRGYDESLVGFGYDDCDVKNRARAMGLEEYQLPLPSTQSLANTDEERVCHMGPPDPSRSWGEIRYQYHYANIEKCRTRGADVVVNPSGFGRATLFKNFSETPIEVGFP